MSVYSGDVWQFRCVQSQQAQEVLNVFYFGIGTGVGHTAQDLTEAWQANRASIMTAVQSTQLTILRYEAQGERGAVDLGLTLGGGDAGAVTGEVLPPFVAWAFRINRDATNYRHSYKRFAGVPESLNENGYPTTAALIDLLTLGAALAANLSDVTAARTYVPLVKQSVVAGSPITPVYRTIAPGYVEFVSISSQNTRKIGRGS